MKTEKMCLEGCIGRLVNVMLERCVPSESRRQEIQQKLDRLYAQTDFARTPSSQSRKILHTLSEELGSADLYQEVKEKSLALAWQLYERIQPKLAALPDPFSAAFSRRSLLAEENTISEHEKKAERATQMMMAIR